MSEQKKTTATPQMARNIFGIIMILIYVGMGILLLCDYFSWMNEGWTWLKWTGGILFIVYGLWRGYRQFKGMDKSIVDRDE